MMSQFIFPHQNYRDTWSKFICPYIYILIVFRILLVDNAEGNAALNITASFDFVLKPDWSSKYIKNSQSLNMILNVLWYPHVSQSSNRTYTPLKMRFHENFIPTNTHTLTCVHTTLIYPTQCSSFISHSTLIWVVLLRKTINHIWNNF